ncbi:MAG: hypothetical protein DMF63_12840 [Acidobacteria bacterium]|nr:MAG: hypothetical protein DMF63_12840 [Acidobacteriota bacterium]
MIHDFQPGDFLIFQLESGFALLRVLDVDTAEEVWHLAAYKDFFLDPDTAEAALDDPTSLAVEKSHVALTNHAFESTQVAKLRNVQLADSELEGYKVWKASEGKEVHDRSIRLLLGLR